MATFNSATKLKLMLTALFLAGSGIVFADSASNQVFAARAETEFQHAQKEYSSNTNISTTAWEFGRACFDWAEFATNKEDRAAIARQGIAACRKLMTLQPYSAPAHYYLGMNLGQLARTEYVGALRLVKEMEREFKTAAGLDKNLDHAGPERNLGLLYREAPGWPWSVGSKRKARSYLELAAKLAPDYPENILNLAESYLKWGDPDQAKKQLKALNSIWPIAQKKFTGQAWEQSWDNWSARRAAVQKKLDEIVAAKPSKNVN